MAEKSASSNQSDSGTPLRNDMAKEECESNMNCPRSYRLKTCESPNVDQNLDLNIVQKKKNKLCTE